MLSEIYYTLGIMLGVVDTTVNITKISAVMKLTYEAQRTKENYVYKIKRKYNHVPCIGNLSKIKKL